MSRAGCCLPAPSWAFAQRSVSGSRQLRASQQPVVSWETLVQVNEEGKCELILLGLCGPQSGSSWNNFAFHTLNAAVLRGAVVPARDQNGEWAPWAQMSPLPYTRVPPFPASLSGLGAHWLPPLVISCSLPVYPITCDCQVGAPLRYMLQWVVFRRGGDKSHVFRAIGTVLDVNPQAARYL